MSDDDAMTPMRELFSTMTLATVQAVGTAHTKLAVARLGEIMASCGDDDEQMEARVSLKMAERDLAAALDSFEKMIDVFRKLAEGKTTDEGGDA